MKKSIAFLFSIFVFISLIQPVLADGCIMVPRLKEWQLHEEERQLAAIHLENGKQNMILAIDVGEIKEEQAVWIFPVPAKPDSVELDIVNGFPEYYGTNLEEEKNDAVSQMFFFLFASQPYSWPVLILSSFMGSMVAGDIRGADLGMASLGNESKGVIVHEHIEKHGLTSELITAENGDAFYGYLYSKDLKLPMFVENTFNEYVGKEYSFVVSWISDANEITKKQVQEEDYYDDYYYYDQPVRYPLGIFVSFPTEKMYFPLKPSSVYGEKSIPVLLYVSGYVTPEIPSNLEYYASIEYFVDHYYVPIDDEESSVKDFFNGKDSFDEFKYTKIKIESKAENFSEDLWINSAVPEKAKFFESIIDNVWFYTLILFILLSCIASLISAKIVFKEDKPDLIKFALFGLTNFFTLYGFVLLAYFLRIDKKFSSIKKDLQKKVGVKQILKSNSIISFLLSLLLLSPFLLILFSSLLFDVSYFLSAFFVFLLLLGAVFILIFILFLPFSWLYHKNRKLFNFSLVFAFFFFILIILSWLLLAVFLA